MVFTTRELSIECTWDTAALLPKGRVDYHRIVLAEVLWKFIAIIIKWRLEESINFHDILQGFRVRQGVGMATLEEKILQKIGGLRCEVL